MAEPVERKTPIPPFAHAWLGNNVPALVEVLVEMSDISNFERDAGSYGTNEETLILIVAIPMRLFPIE